MNYWQLPLSVLVIIVSILAGVCIIALIYRMRKKQEIHHADKRPSDHVTYAFIINPSKPEAQTARAYITDYCNRNNIHNILFIDTQLDKDGRACAEEALQLGADVVIAVGGDGTVRTVASAMAYSTHAFGIIPIGTGNLFARNMNIPVNNLEAALLIATSHGSRRVDMGRISLLDSAEPEHEHGFLIISGAGFDANMINDTNPALKNAVSWIAYFFAAFKHLFGKKTRATIIMRDSSDKIHMLQNIPLRTIMAGNCGEIPGFSLMPAAEFDDGILDIETIDTRGGLIGWFGLFSDVLHKTLTRRTEQSPFATHATIQQYQAKSAEVILDHPMLVEVDGDILQESAHFMLSIDRQTLIVRAPHHNDISATGTLPPLPISSESSLSKNNNHE